MSSSRGRRLVNALLVVTLVVYALYAASAQVNGADLWWTLAAGRYIAAHRAVPGHDVFSYTYAGAPWFNQEWLAEVVYFELFRVWGGIGLVLCKLAIVSALVFLATWIGWRRSGSLVLASGAAVAAVFVCRPYFDIRAQLFAFVGTLALLAVVEAYRHGARVGVLVLLPVVTLLWANLHPSFLYGLGALLLIAGSELLKSRFGLPDAPMPLGRALRLGAAAGAAGLACLVNPHHLRAITYPFAMLGTESPWRGEILEWLPPVLFQEQYFNPAFFGYFLVAEMLVTVAAAACVPRRFDVTDLLLVGVTGGMALSARRFVPLFALVSVPFLAKNLALVRDRFLPRPAGAPELHRVRGAAAVAILCAASLGLLLVRFVPYAREAFAPGLFEGLTFADFFPAGAVEFLARNPLPGRLFHLYSWGGYLMYWLPDRKVFIDGRGLLVYPTAFYLEHKTAENGDPGWNEVLDRHQVALVVWPSSGYGARRYGVMLQQLRQSPSWRCVYEDGQAAVFAHVERGRSWIEAHRSTSLRYPERPGAQLFLANALLEANEFARARDHLRDVVRRFPETRDQMGETESRWLEAARTTNAAMAWFGVGFYRDVRGDAAGATEAFRRALEGGLTDPQASYAREALEEGH